MGGDAALGSMPLGTDGSRPAFTIGHSTRTIAEFVQLLRAGDVDFVVDIRRIPHSRTNPKYNLDVLSEELRGYGIAHIRIGELGGLRKGSADVPAEVNAFWNNRSFHNYADYALTPAFREGLDQLLQLTRTHRTAIMCAEAVWWRCHRRIVADYLIQAGLDTYHLMGTKEVKRAILTPAAVPAADGLHYPASR